MASATTTPKQYVKRPLHDPPVRRDGKCVVCGGDRPTPNDPKGIYRTWEDPFCSTQCCKSYYRVSYEVADQPMSRDMSR